MATLDDSPETLDHAFTATIFAQPHANSQGVVTDDILANFVLLITTIITSASTNQRYLDESPHPRVAEVNFSSSDQFSLKALRKHPNVLAFELQHLVQIAIQVDNVYRCHKRLAVFDMDSTLIQQEVIDEIARKLGVEDKVSAITERAMNGELDFTQSLRERCALLKGVSSSVFEDLKQVITLSPGAADLVRVLKKLGYTTAVLSGGFLPLTSWQAQQLSLDYAHANHLVVSEDGQSLTGEVTGTIVDSIKKRELLSFIATQHHLSSQQVLAVGDGANDLPMLWASGLGVAFNAKARVQQQAPVKLNSSSLLDILYLLGFTSTQQQQLLADAV